MQKITDWWARRAGGRMTINGIDARSGAPIKIVGVDEIKAGTDGAKPVATDKNGERYELA